MALEEVLGPPAPGDPRAPSSMSCDRPAHPQSLGQSDRWELSPRTAGMAEIDPGQPSWLDTTPVGRASVFVIDSDAGRQRYAGRILRGAGLAVTGFTDFAEARPALEGHGCEVLLVSLDRRWEDCMAALRVCCPVRPLPFLVLALIEEEDEQGSAGAVARTLDAGADDCLAFPFDASDLAARVVRLLRLTWSRRGMTSLSQMFNMQIDLTRPCVRVDGCEIKLTQLEYRALWALVQGKGGVSSFRDIELQVWGEGDKPHRRALRRVIRNLRLKLGNGPLGRVLLLAVPRVGYRLCPKIGSRSPPTPVHR